MFDTILKTVSRRLLFAVFAAMLFKLIVDVIFGLLYINYPIELDTLNFLSLIVFAFVMVEGMYRINTRLGVRMPWDRAIFKRLLAQSALNLLWVLLVLFISRLLSMIFQSAYIQFNQEAIFAVTAFFLLMAFQFSDMGLFLLRKWRWSVAELERFKKENLEFRFEMLKAQINPHFLFNSLNTLSSLVHSNQEIASVYIRKLSSVYRSILENRDKEVLTLGKELDVLESYLYMVRLRFRDRLQVTYDIPSSYHSMYISQLSLQMLIENAIKHNVMSEKRPLHIDIYMEKDNYLVVKNVLQLKTSREYSSQIGLENIKNRYRFMTDKPVLVLSDEAHFYVKLPLLKEDYEHRDH